MNKRRPYFNKSINELEQIFDENQKNKKVLSALANELTNRKTPKAKALAKKVGEHRDTPVETRPATRKTAEPKSVAKQMSLDIEDSIAPSTQKSVPLIKRVTTPKPPIKNDPQNILRAWTALEVLSPQSFQREEDLAGGDKRSVARLKKGEPLPWEIGERSRPRKRLFYELFLGTISLAPAVESLLRVYSDTRPDKPSMRGQCPLASVLLDKEGRPLDEDNSVAIASFAWGVPVALTGDLTALADWSVREKLLLSSLRKKLFHWDSDEELKPLNKSIIQDAFKHLVSALNLQGHDIKAPYFVLRRYEFFASKTPPEPCLLNSFFLDDLSKVRRLAEQDKLSNALAHYLGMKKPQRKGDLLRNERAIQYALQPALTPLGRWPSHGRFPLALLQQASVNATDLTQLETGILGVNGPPGTGKTTLLRDIVAARIVERATVMSKLSDPSKAFKETTATFQRSNAKISLYKIDQKLRGFEMVVASSNNKAVENVSAELPSMTAIADDAPGLRYFSSISDHVLERETWGLIAAVLGNSTNRYNFSQKFWHDEEHGLATYLNHASGIPQIVSEPQESGPPVTRKRSVVDKENPPRNKKEALQRWRQSQERFSSALARSAEQQTALQNTHRKLSELQTLNGRLNNSREQAPRLGVEIELLEKKILDAENDVISATNQVTSIAKRKSDLFKTRPGVFARLFKTSLFKGWRTQFDAVNEKLLERENTQSHAQALLDALNKELSDNREKADQLEAEISSLTEKIRSLSQSVNKECEAINVPVPDGHFFEKDHAEKQIANVWFDDACNRLRDDVFEAAMHLHRAFIDCAADPIRQNLSIFTESFGTRSLGTSLKNDLISDLWATFFLVVPVVSTTFASVHKMFSRLNPETLGWLLVDEAGQALPQAAVGAMLRTKRSVIVGDPLQIEPVVTLPTSLTQEICAYFGIDALKYNAPEASAQTVADQSSLYCATFPSGSGYRDVGAPLLVHRRCNSPMFEISNEIAYSNLMVQAKKPTSENPVLGPSSWIDVIGTSGPDKWCADEATELIQMLQKLKNSGAEPDLYIVTPFVIVQNNLRQELKRNGLFDDWTEKPNNWIDEHVGTVHTVQGREAKIVFFVLGAQSPSQNGARNWAGGKPNLVNVAVTRAKSSLYVIGNRQLWRSAGVFSVLDKWLPAMML